MRKKTYRDCLLQIANSGEQPAGYYNTWEMPEAFEVLTFETGGELLVMVSSDERERRRRYNYWSEYKAGKYKAGTRHYVKRDTSHITRRPEMLSTTDSEGNLQ